jgi:transcriptional regulator with XRE-family HTH domain
MKILINKVMYMNRIRELRKQKDMTQKELAKLLQIADSTLSYWEIGKYEPDIKALIKLSRFFEVSIDYILGSDLTRWDLDTSAKPYPCTEPSRFTGAEMSVSEYNETYRASNLISTYEAFNRVEF